jgi:hypothetical protein
VQKKAPPFLTGPLRLQVPVLSTSVKLKQRDSRPPEKHPPGKREVTLLGKREVLPW